LNIAENCPFIDGLPMKNGGLPIKNCGLAMKNGDVLSIAMLNSQRLLWYILETSGDRHPFSYTKTVF